MGRRPRSANLTFTVALGLSTLLPASSARAEAEPDWAASDIVIWYRASQACPPGQDFVSRVRVEGRTARLARAGDHVDYVVTLDSDGKSSTGRLERQSARGTIAMSELRGGPCGEVSEALALSLALAVTPREPEPRTSVPEAAPAPSAGGRGGGGASPTTGGLADNGSESADRVAGNGAGIVKGRAEPLDAPVAAAKRPSEAAISSGQAERARVFQPHFWIGGGLKGALGMTREPSLGGWLFIEHEWAAAWSSVRRASVRIGPSFRYSRVAIDGFGHVDHWLPALGLELCPVRFEGTSFGFAPCVVSEGGLFVARSERDTALTSANFWLALGPAVRGTARVGSRLRVGLTATVLAPFSRPEITAGSKVLYRTPPALFSLGADISWAAK